MKRYKSQILTAVLGLFFFTYADAFAHNKKGSVKAKIRNATTKLIQHKSIRTAPRATKPVIVSAPVEVQGPVQVKTQVVVRTSIRPPVLRTQVISPRPSLRAVWIPGYWIFDMHLGRYVWVIGYWDPHPLGISWSPGYWTNVNGYYYWNDGYWLYR